MRTTLTTIPRILHVLLPLLFSTIVLTSCSSDDITETEEQPIAVTYSAIAGSWQLTEYCGSPLPEGTYLYLTFDRRDHLVSIYTNISSSYPLLREGTFTITGDEYYGYTLSGSYGVVAGDWNHSYHVTLYPSGRMSWTATDTPSFTQLFKRIDTIPQ